MRNTKGLALGTLASTAKFKAMTHCRRGHPYEGDNLRIDDVRGYKVRVCKTCHKERVREADERRTLKKRAKKQAVMAQHEFEARLKKAPKPYRAGLLW